MKSVEKTGKSVDEAISEALKELSARREDVEIEILDEGSKGFLGILGGKLARVRVSVKDSIESKVDAAVSFLEKLFSYMGVEPEIEREVGQDGLVYLRMSGKRMGVIIGRRGQTLDAIQYLVNLTVNQGPQGTRVRFVLDAEGYRDKRAESLRGLAERMAAKAKSDRRKVALEPMSALERRIVHMALADDREIETYSEGDDPYRRVIIAPKR